MGHMTFAAGAHRRDRYGPPRAARRRRSAALVLAAALAGAGAGDTAWAAADPEPCRESAEVRIWTSPRSPRAGTPLRVLAVAENAPLDDLTAHGPDGSLIPADPNPRGGPPWSLDATIPYPAPGAHRVDVRRAGAGVACRTVAVGPAGARGAADDPLVWDGATEALYAAWIERLFDAPPGEDVAFRPLHEALRDPDRNFLHDHLGLGEDDAGSATALVVTPDCADLPYVLRAYFAWKLDLPVAYRPCDRGGAGAPPRCGTPVVRTRWTRGAGAREEFQRFHHALKDGVHSGNARAALAAEATDFYPVLLERDALRPGTIFADPYGHTLMIVKWVPQTADRGGLLLAVDAQPDLSVGRKRFWEGNFLFGDDTVAAGPGFKAMRPAAPRPLSNAALRDANGFVPFSLEQAAMTADAFYARMAKLINPDGLTPAAAHAETLAALVEQLEARVESVDRGEEYVHARGAPTVAMPEGAAIFETVGPWEDYATPSRDMRVLIAMNVLADLPERIVRHPELYVLDGTTPAEARATVERLHGGRAAERSITYTRSDGSPWTLTVADVLARRPALEMAYNPNDCVEIRWGAAEDSAEYAPCRRHAPAAQHARMRAYRPWFRETRRPPR